MKIFKTPIEKIAANKINEVINSHQHQKKLENTNENNQNKEQDLKGLHLNKEEKDSFIGILGFIRTKINKIRDFELISIDSFFSI